MLLLSKHFEEKRLCVLISHVITTLFEKFLQLEMEHQVITDYTDVNTDNANVKVYVRARPPDSAESPGDFLQV